MAKNFNVKTYNKIAQIGIDRFKPSYKVAENTKDPDAIMLRSFNLHDEPITDSVVAVGRAGAGVNNIPIGKLSEAGVVVFNAPGANANSVKELVIAGMLLAGRNLAGALEYTNMLSEKNMKEEVEAGKKKFVGRELYGKTCGVIGLGAIGYRVANAALDLGMQVVGYDPAMTIKNARQLSSSVNMVEDIDELLKSSDFVSIHVPLFDATKGMIDKKKISLLKPGSVFINFSRDELVNEKEMLKSLDSGKVEYYVTDFPNAVTRGHKKVISLPHLGASTEEAEDNCAVMIADQLQDFLENGNIQNSVNLPNVVLSRKGPIRLALIHYNEPGVVAQISNILSAENINILDLLNRSRDKLAYTVIDLPVGFVSKDLEDKLRSISEVRKLRILT
ncbi:MAG TPA: 3-phosphoglycerate dehydrogenase family protein [Patescibacteria group bacterium]|nr:3-phosphoglycerate dehydrogenase family protein [Patescibacteria group bacterium]